MWSESLFSNFTVKLGTLQGKNLTKKYVLTTDISTIFFITFKTNILPNISQNISFTLDKSPVLC